MCRLLPGDMKNDSDFHDSPDDDNDVDWSYGADKKCEYLYLIWSFVFSLMHG